MFTDAEIEMLSKVAGLIIPASLTYEVPGADDPAIMAEILVSAGRREEAVRAALAAFEEVGDAGFQTSHPAEAAVLQTIVASCYYRDPRVLTSLGREARAPMPKGFEVEEGDFSLLDPVRARGPVWRRVEGGAEDGS